MARTSEQLTIQEVIWVQQGAQGDLKLIERTAPSTDPTSGQLYAKSSDHNLYFLDSQGTEYQLTPSSSGGGDVTGPGSSTDNAIALFDGTTGKIIKNSLVTIDESGFIKTPGVALYDSDESNALYLINSQNLSADHELNIITGDADRTLTLSGNLTVSSSATISGTNSGDQTTSGTSNRISVTNGSTNPVIDISGTYVGQSSITTLGTITTGVWNAGTILANSPFTQSISSTAQILGSSAINYLVSSMGASVTMSANEAYFPLIIRQPTFTEASSGTHPAVGSVAIRAPVITNGSAATTNAVTLYVEGAPTGTASPTNVYGFWLDQGDARLDGNILLSTGAALNWNAGNVTLTQSSNLLTLSGGGLNVTGAVSESALGSDRASLGVMSGTPRLILEDSGNTIWEIDNSSGVMRFITPGTTRYQFLTSSFDPGSNDSASLGTTTLSWSDLFLASGGIINWNNGNATITHSSGLLTSNVDIVVPDEVYGSGWNGNLEVPTKNAVYDKIESLSTGITWNEVTGTSQSAAVNNGYILNNSSLVTLTLPSTAAQGSIIEVAGKGSGGWKIAQNASQTIHFGNTNTTTGTGGSLASTNQYDSLTILCITANTDFIVLSSVGNITIV